MLLKTGRRSGLELSFVKRNWEDAENPLAFITLFSIDN
jgi:hypothetical protein